MVTDHGIVITLNGVDLSKMVSSMSMSMEELRKAMIKSSIGISSFCGVFSVADIRSPQFAKQMTAEILGRYEIPPCDEVSVELVDLPTTRQYQLTVTVLGFTSFHYFSDLELASRRDSATWVQSLVMKMADVCWTEVIK